MEPVAVGVEAGFNIIVIPGDVVSLAESFGHIPGFALELQAFDMRVKIGMTAKGVAEFMQSLEVGICAVLADENSAVLI